MAERSQVIEDLAGAILDGATIDWGSAESSTEFGDRALLSQLRVVAAVAALHRRGPPSTASNPISPTDVSLSQPSGAPIVNGKYRIERSLGHGGMGFVYCARHVDLDKRFALKLLHPHRSFRPDAIVRFQVEAHAVGRLNHPNIVQVTDFGVDSAVGPYLVMEYIEGTTLAEHMRREGPLRLAEALPILSSIGHALDCAHACGILHRDLKPGNVLLFTREDGRRDAKIVDFGIASFVEGSASLEAASASAAHAPQPEAATPAAWQNAPRSVIGATSLTAPGSIVGTLEYIAPEIIDGGKASAAADIFSFGVLIYEVLVGRRPFARSLEAPLDAQARPDPPLPSRAQPSLPSDLDQAILAPLQSDPTRRPLRAQDVVSGLSIAAGVAAVRQWRRTELPKRGAMAMLVSVAVALAYGPLQRVSVVQTLESICVDLRMAFQPRRSPDPRILLIAIDDATLASDAQPLAGMADEVGDRLQQVFGAGARTIAIDLLLPEQWSRSDSFIRLIVRHSNDLVLASYAGADGRVSGLESVQGLITAALGPYTSERLFGLVNVSADGDGVVRTLPLVYQDQRGARVFSLAARAAEIFTGRVPVGAASKTRLWLDYSIDWTRFMRVSWKDVPEAVAKQPHMFRDRVVLVGGEFVGSGDMHNTSLYLARQPRLISGLVLQALALNTLLADVHIDAVDRTLAIGLVTVGCFGAVVALLMAARGRRTVGALTLGVVLYVVLSVLLFRSSHVLSPMVPVILLFSLATTAALVLRTRLSPHPVPGATP